MSTVLEDCFSNPYNNPTDIKDLLLDYDEWAAEYLQKPENERPDFSDPTQFPECNKDGESVFKPYDEWFGAAVTGCDFKIQLQSQYYSDAGNEERSTQSKFNYSMKNGRSSYCTLSYDILLGQKGRRCLRRSTIRQELGSEQMLL